MLLLIWLRILLPLSLVVVVVVVASSGLLPSSTGSVSEMAVSQTHRTSFSLILPLLLVDVLSRNDCTFLLSRSRSASSCSFRCFLIRSLLATRTASFCSGLCSDQDTLCASVAFLRHITFFPSVFPLHFFFFIFTSSDLILIFVPHSPSPATAILF